MTNDRELGLRIADREAKRINKRFGVRAPSHIKVRAYAAAFGVKLIESKLDGALARLKAGPEPIIRVSDRCSDSGELEFSIAHELGHHLLVHAPSKVSALCKDVAGVRPVRAGTTRHAEAEANTFSAGVCMPSELLERPIASAIPSLDFVRASIANEYTMSMMASAIRFAELSPERCAALYAEAGKVVWCVRSSTFTWRIERGHRLDAASVAVDFFTRRRLDECSQPVPADAWIPTEADVEIVEHSVVVPRGTGVLTLLWVPEAAAEAIDDGD